MGLVIETVESNFGIRVTGTTCRQFTGHFGLDVYKVALLWMIMVNCDTTSALVHVLWLLKFLRCYPTIDELEHFTGRTNKTLMAKIQVAATELSRCVNNVRFKMVS